MIHPGMPIVGPVRARLRLVPGVGVGGRPGILLCWLGGAVSGMRILSIRHGVTRMLRGGRRGEGGQRQCADRNQKFGHVETPCDGVPTLRHPV
jgi:hypothetical protein